MKYLSKSEFESQMRKIKLENVTKERKQKLKDEKKKYKSKSRFKLPSTSKLVLLVVFLICIEILIFSQYAMVKTGDISALYTLIGVPVTLVPICIAYMIKSKTENSVGGIVYETAMAQLNQVNWNFGVDESGIVNENIDNPNSNAVG